MEIHIFVNNVLIVNEMSLHELLNRHYQEHNLPIFLLICNILKPHVLAIIMYMLVSNNLLTGFIPLVSFSISSENIIKIMVF